MIKSAISDFPDSMGNQDRELSLEAVAEGFHSTTEEGFHSVMRKLSCLESRMESLLRNSPANQPILATPRDMVATFSHTASSTAGAAPAGTAPAPAPAGGATAAQNSDNFVNPDRSVTREDSRWSAIAHPYSTSDVVDARLTSLEHKFDEFMSELPDKIAAKIVEKRGTIAYPPAPPSPELVQREHQPGNNMFFFCTDDRTGGGGKGGAGRGS